MCVWGIFLVSDKDSRPWQTVLTEGVEQYDPENYENSLSVTSYNGDAFFGWAACRRFSAATGWFRAAILGTAQGPAGDGLETGQLNLRSIIFS